MAFVQLLIKQRNGLLNEYMTGHFDWLPTFPTIRSWFHFLLGALE